LDPQICTHIIFSFLGIDGNGNLNFMNRGESAASAALQDAIKLRSRNPSLKILAAIGGYNDEMVHPWSNLAANSGSRLNLANNIVNILQRFNLNGIDIDWEYPNRDEDRPQDKQNFISLLRDIRNRLKSSYSLSVAIGAGAWRTGLSYNIKELFQICDFVNLMTYDLHGGWDKKTGLHSALYRGSSDNTPANVDESVKLLLSFGVDRSKIIVGIPTYGYRFLLKNAANNGIGAPASYHPKPSIAYREICKNARSRSITVRFDEQQKTPYAVSGNEWFSFENVRSVTEKANYINNNGFGGAMFWYV
jgi:chitinase